MRKVFWKRTAASAMAAAGDRRSGSKCRRHIYPDHSCDWKYRRISDAAYGRSDTDSSLQTQKKFKILKNIIKIV